MTSFNQFALYSINAGLKADVQKIKDKCDIFLEKISTCSNYCKIINIKNAIFGIKSIEDDEEIIECENHFEFEDGSKTLDFEYNNNTLRVIARRNNKEFFFNEYVYHLNDVIYEICN